MKFIITGLLSFFLVWSLTAQSPCIDGFVEDNWNCSNVDMWAYMTLNEIGGGDDTNDCWGWTDPESFREFALVGKNNGTAFVEITDPENPIYLGELPTATSNTLWRDIKVYNNHAYIVSEAGDHGLQVFDLTQLLDVEGTDNTFEVTSTLNDFGHSHNIIINESTGFAYEVGSDLYSGGLHCIDLSDPMNPETVGGFGNDGYTHDGQVVVYKGEDEDYFGQEIAFAANEDFITIVDVTVKDDMEMISQFTYSDVGYTHQLWLSTDHKYVFFNDELDELDFDVNTRTYMADISDLDNPVMIGFYEAGNTAIDHNLYTEGNFIYASNYRSGLRILDYGDVANGNLIERGFFDVSPSNDNPQFSGSWSNYCYFPSGSVIVTDINDGFFVLRPRVFSLSEDVFEVSCEQDTYEFEITFATELSGSNFSIAQDGLPEDVVISATEIVAPGTTTVTLSNLEVVPEGEYFFDILIVSESYGEYLIEGHLISQQTPVAPELTYPIEGEVINITGDTFEWAEIEGATSYTIEIASDELFEDIFITETVLTNSYDYTPDLDGEIINYWRVSSIGLCGEGIESETGMFSHYPISVEEYSGMNLSLFPNPVEDNLRIEFNSELESIQILDISGKLLKRFAVSGTAPMTLDFSSYSKGTYILLTSEGESYRLIKR